MTRFVTQIRIERLSKSYGETLALNAVDLEIGSGELFFLLGPSGCGKTTLLRMIAGLQMPGSGRILFDGRDVTSVPTQNRNAVMCFQGYALWPHLTVRENIRFGLSVRGVPPDKDAQLAEVDEALGIIQMPGELADRKPQQLSGGQQQRVALARAIAVKPACLLLDEPLSNLDTNLRQDMRREIQRICRESGITTVWVTHDQKEALSTGDRIAVMKDGKLAQVGTPQQLYRSPASAFVAEFIGPTNLAEGEIVGSREGFVHVATAIGTIVGVAQATGDGMPAASGRAVVSIRPELIRVVRDRESGPPHAAGGAGCRGDAAAAGGEGPGGAAGAARGAAAAAGPGVRRFADPEGTRNRFAGTVVEETFLGQSSEHLIAVGNGHLRVVSAPPQSGLQGNVALEIDAGDVVVLSR
jgi:iron(III) transport system ATP-binding protein